MKHRCGHPKVGERCKVCAAAQSQRAYTQLLQGAPIWRTLATKVWRKAA